MDYKVLEIRRMDKGQWGVRIDDPRLVLTVGKTYNVKFTFTSSSPFADDTFVFTEKCLQLSNGKIFIVTATSLRQFLVMIYEPLFFTMVTSIG